MSPHPFVETRTYGDYLSFRSLRILWGNTDFGPDQQRVNFPNVPLSFLRQVHSSRIVAAQAPTFDLSPKKTPPPGAQWWLDDSWPEADGHWTKAPGHALAIITADCLPIFLYSTDATKDLLGVHAGWRGLTEGILDLAVNKFPPLSSSELFAFVGPHIRRQSFTFSDDHLDPLLTYAQRLGLHRRQFIFPGQIPGKVQVDLTVLAHASLISSGLHEENIWISPHDTFADRRWHSYRRNSANAGRQVSLAFFIDSDPSELA